MEAAGASIERGDGGVLFLEGPLVFSTVDTVLTRSLTLLPAEGSAVLDFTGVEHTDSAALALIVEWRKLAARRGLTLELRGLPGQLRALSSAAGLETLCD
jgi:phospholipid transport system transporter-binding protein